MPVPVSDIPVFDKAFVVKVVGAYAARYIYDTSNGSMVGDIRREDLIQAIKAYIAELDELEKNNRM